MFSPTNPSLRVRLFLIGAVLVVGLAKTRAADGVRVLSDVAYLEPSRTERLDIYLPPDDSRSGSATVRAAVVYFHGGGWVRGDKATEREQNIGNGLARAGYVFVSVNYVLGPNAWPQNLRDCKNAVRFLRANAARYGVDPNRIAAMGTSAGGHLALMAAYTADVGPAGFEPAAPYPNVSSAVRAVINFYGMTNLLTRQLALPDGTPSGKPADSNSPAVLGATRTEDPARWRLASPVMHVTKTSPPTLIVHGLSDPTVDYVQAVELANVLRAQSVAHELVLLEGIGHQFYLNVWNDQPMRDLTPVVVAFLETHLSHSPIAGVAK
jgi:acetyl esterase/lipase